MWLGVVFQVEALKEDVEEGRSGAARELEELKELVKKQEDERQKEMKEQHEQQKGEVSRLREELRDWTEVSSSWRAGMTNHEGFAGGTKDGYGGKDREATEDYAE